MRSGYSLGIALKQNIFPGSSLKDMMYPIADTQSPRWTMLHGMATHPGLLVSVFCCQNVCTLRP